MEGREGVGGWGVGEGQGLIMSALSLLMPVRRGVKHNIDDFQHMFSNVQGGKVLGKSKQRCWEIQAK